MLLVRIDWTKGLPLVLFSLTEVIMCILRRGVPTEYTNESMNLLVIIIEIIVHCTKAQRTTAL